MKAYSRKLQIDGGKTSSFSFLWSYKKQKLFRKKNNGISDSRLLPKHYNYYLTADSITTLNRDVFLRLSSFFLSPLLLQNDTSPLRSTIYKLYKCGIQNRLLQASHFLAILYVGRHL